jgi:hypothetical protein
MLAVRMKRAGDDGEEAVYVYGADCGLSTLPPLYVSAISD